MARLIYSMTQSLDGYIADQNGEIDWSAPDEELHQFHNDRVRELGAHILGRRLYEAMTYWDTPDPSWGDIEHDFAAIWKPLPKLVFSTTLETVSGNARLATGDLADEVTALKESLGPDVGVGVGGATLAAACAKLDLIDEYELFVAPIVLGGGTPFFPPLEERVPLELVETREFGSRVVFLRYRRA
jgi:dihydrofolate reductase